MLNNRPIVAFLIVTLIAALVVCGIFLFRRDKEPDTPDIPDVSEPSETTTPNTDEPNETVKVEDETKPGISPTPFVDIEEGNEIYFDADVVAMLELLHEEGDEDLVNDMSQVNGARTKNPDQRNKALLLGVKRLEKIL